MHLMAEYRSIVHHYLLSLHWKRHLSRVVTFSASRGFLVRRELGSKMSDRHHDLATTLTLLIAVLAMSFPVESQSLGKTFAVGKRLGDFESTRLAW